MIIDKKYIPILKQCSRSLCKYSRYKTDSALERELKYEARLLYKIIFSGIHDKIAPYEQRQAKTLVLANQKLLFGLAHTVYTTTEKRNLSVSLNYYHSLHNCLHNGYTPKRCAQAMTHLLRFIYLDVQGLTKHHIYKGMNIEQAQKVFRKDMKNKSLSHIYIYLYAQPMSYSYKHGLHYTQTLTAPLIKGHKTPQYCIVSYSKRNYTNNFPVLPYSPTVTLTSAVFKAPDTSFRYLLQIFLNYGVKQAEHRGNERLENDIIQNSYYLNRHKISQASIQYLSKLIYLTQALEDFLSNHSKRPMIAGPFHITDNLIKLVEWGNSTIEKLFIKKYHGSKRDARKTIGKIKNNI